MVSDLDRFVHAWLAPARIAPPTIDFVSMQAEAGGISGSVTPLRPETAAWNQWTNGELRLFNNRAGLLFEVKLQSDQAVRWIPERTHLVLDDETRVPSTARADELLIPLMRMALTEERWVIPGDLVARTRAAGAFRAAYLPMSGSKEVAGIVAFVLPRPDQQVTRVSLHLALLRGGEEVGLDLLWD